MQLLRELARLGTIAAVAQAAFCTPSAVSQQLSALEREAGVPLIRRIRHYADDFAAVLTLVAAGQGVALVPGLALADRPPVSR